MEEAAAAEEVCASDLLENLSREGCERQREHYKTIDLITEYNDFHVGMQLAGHLPLSSLENRAQKAHFCGFQENMNNKVLASINHFM